MLRAENADVRLTPDALKLGSNVIGSEQKAVFKEKK